MNIVSRLKLLVGLTVVALLSLIAGVGSIEAQVIFATATPRMTSIATQQPLMPDTVLLARGGITFRVESVISLPDFDGETPANGMLMLIKATLYADGFRCVYGYNFKLIVEGNAYDAPAYWMEKFKPQMEIDYPRRDLAGQCIYGKVETPTYLVFDAPIDGKSAELVFLNAAHAFGWSGELSTATATFLPTFTTLASVTPTNTAIPTMIPTLTPRPVYPTSVPTAVPPRVESISPAVQTQIYSVINQANVRSCPRTSCEIIITYGMNQTLDIAETVDGDAVNGSARWYLVRLPSGRAAYVHNSVVRFGLPEPVAPPVVQQNVGAAEQPVWNQAAQSASPAPAGNGFMGPPWDCSYNKYNCSDFDNSFGLLSDYWAACPGDPSRLDGNPKNGRPCDGSWD